MTKNILSVLCALVICLSAGARENGIAWKQVAPSSVRPAGMQKIYPQQYKLYSLGDAALKAGLLDVPSTPATATLIELPMPDGNTRSFKVWETPMLPPQLAAKYPAIKTFTAVATDDPSVMAKLDMTSFGFHAMVLDGPNTYFLDPYTDVNDGYYMCYFKHDLVRPEGQGMPCEMTDAKEDELQQQRIDLTPSGLPGNTPMKLNGTQKRTYILALAATGEYSAKVGAPSPTKANVLGAMTTTMNRVNGVYERELGITMQFHPKEDTLIFFTSMGYDNSNGGLRLGRNQTVIDSLLPLSDYDIGHVFATGGGGIAQLGCVCNSNTKAEGTTGDSNPTGDGFDIDYVAHEMGHQFGANHTFNVNSNSGSCTGNGVMSSAYEPGSGSTIMAYAGICGTANNIQAHSDDYFHAKSLDQITNFVTGSGNCSVNTASGDVPPIVPPFTQSYNIPYKTPFELTAPDAVDADHDVLTYCWDQWNRGDFGKSLVDTLEFGPLFRSFKPVTYTTRVFPALDKLVNNITSYVGEKLPAKARNMTFRLTVRDMLNGTGTFNFADDSIVLHVINTGTPFAVTGPNTAADYWQIASNVTVTWDVASTTASPISCSNVDIFLSIDNGFTYPFVLVQGTPNDGSETITVPYAPTLTARVKVKGSGNVFFDISNENFKINTWPAEIKAEQSLAKEMQIFPNPVTDKLMINFVNNDEQEMSIINTVGQLMWKGTVVKTVEMNVSGWAKGIYMVQLKDKASKEMTVKKLVVK